MVNEECRAGISNWLVRSIENAEGKIKQRFKSFALILLMGIAAASLAVPSARATVVLDVVGGQLLGATGVVVDSFGGFGGGTYDVEFLDGSCAELFLPCNPLQMPPGIQTAPFIGDGDAAFSAGNALLGQVFTGFTTRIRA